MRRLHVGSVQAQALQIAIAADQPTILWGQPGEGKSSTIETMTTQHGIHLEVIIGSQYEPSDIAGQPWVVDVGEHKQRMEHLLPAWARKIVDLPRGSPAVVFFDELDKCPPAVQNACLRVIRERVVGDIHLPDTCRVVAAANYPEVGGGFDLTAPMSNRLLHIDWDLDPSTVLIGLGAGLWPVMDPVFPTSAQIRAARGLWRARLSAYLASRHNLMRVVPKKEQEQGRPWPSPRSWESIVPLGAVADILGAPNNVIELLINGLVGDKVGDIFVEWMYALPVVSPAEVMQPDFVLPSDGDHVTYCAMLAVGAAAVQPIPEVVHAAHNFCVRVYKAGFPEQIQTAAITLRKIMTVHNVPEPSTV